MTSSCIKPFPSCLLPAVPRGGPHIQGYKTEVSLGDELQLNCTSLKSKPAAKLQFYINNKVSPTTLFSVRISWRCLSRERFRDYRKRTFRSFLFAFSRHFDLCDCALKAVVRKEQLQ